MLRSRRRHTLLSAPLRRLLSISFTCFEVEQ
jgi:hypothetical protein